MSGASIFWFGLSVGGLLVSMIPGLLWLWWRPGAPGPRRYLGVVVAAFTLASLYPVPHAVGSAWGAGFRPFAPGDVPAGSRVVVLLGSGNDTVTDWDGRLLSVLNTIAAERTIEAARVHRLARADWIISSGGIVDPDDQAVPDGEVMRDGLVSLGVPRERILVEAESRSTRDEAVVVARMVKLLQVEHVILVTSQVHMRRSLGAFRAAGLSAIPAVSKDWTTDDRLAWILPSNAGLRLSALVVHELIGTLYYRLRGWYTPAP